MNGKTMILLGALILILAVAFLITLQVLLYRWLKKFKQE